MKAHNQEFLMLWKHNFKHVDASESLQAYAETAFSKDGKFLLKDSQFQIFYSKGKHHHECQVDVTVQNGTGHFKASGISHSFYQAVDEAAHKLGKQLQKKKEKLQHHKDYDKSKEGRLERVSSRLEYDNSLFPTKKTG
jgi:ribosomal subunit interface protein